MRQSWMALWAGSAALVLSACQAQQAEPAEAATDSVAATNCIGTAMEGTVFSTRAGTDLAGAFAAQDHDGCPPDFMQQFTATANALQLVVAAQSELQAHLGKEDETRQNSALSMAGDVWNQQPSGKTILSDWQERKAKLEERLSDQRTSYEKAKADLIAMAARYNVYPEPQAIDARVTDDPATAAPVPAGNAQ